MLSIARVVFLFVLTWISGQAAAADRDVYVPDELKPWQAWVLKGKEYRECPFFFNRALDRKDDFICAWPGRLDLTVDADGGRFRQRWTVYSTDEWIPLPGDASNWPQQITVNGQPVAVVGRGDIPSVQLAPGRHDIGGQFKWDERPRLLRIPPQSGLLDVSIDGGRVSRPDRNGHGVWLGEREQEKKAEDALQVQVYRLLADDVPTRLTTVLRLEVAGSVREELIGPAMPEGFTPLAIESALPTRLEPDGNLRLQVRPGSWEVTLAARAADVLSGVTLPEPDNNLPATEIWSYLSNDKLRVSVPEGLAPVDPLQAGVPDRWTKLPGFRIAPGETLTITERSRGRIAADNQLTLARQFWLDFNGEGFVFSDGLRGNMRSEWRLDMRQPYALLSATENDENLLVTLGAEEGLSGVEVRQSNVGLQAVGRTESRGTLAVTGWQSRFNSVTASLHLPPGNKLLAAIGADRSSMSWVNRWKLLDFFLVLIISISAARLFGRGTGLLSLLALTLSLHESGAPGFIWLNLLVAVALVRVAPAGRLLELSKLYRVLSLVGLIVMFVPFAAEQLRIAIYPQLEPQGYATYPPPATTVTGGAFEAKDVVSDVAERGLARTAEVLRAPESQLEEIVVTGARAPRSFNRYAPNAIVQVGPGRPAWRWNTYRLSWSGPVAAEQTMRLIVMPRWLVSLLRFVEVGLLGAFVAVFVFEFLKRQPPWARGRAKSGPPASSATTILAVVTLASLAFMTPPAAHADTPSDTILNELEKRLLEPPPCTPRCAEIIDASAFIGADAMTIRLMANALDTVAVSLPGSLQGWRPEQIRIDGAPAAQVYRSQDQTLWVRVTAGRRVISLQGPLPPVDTLEVPFPTPPRVIRVDTSEWFVAGIKDQRLLSGSLQLTRLQKQADQPADADTGARWESSRFPVFGRVERLINLDLDWRVTTTVYRVAPTQGAVTLNVPLLPGESVITEGFTVTDGEILVSMNPTQPAASWESTLPRTSPLALEARSGAPWKEVWRFAIGSIWHAGFDGVPESETGEIDLGYRVAQFFPRPGETLAMSVDRPEASSGDTLVFDEVRLSSQVGERSRTSDLTLKYRSTRGSQHVIGLPVDAEIISVVIDSEVAPLRPENGELRVPILPGVHDVAIEWRNDHSLGYRESVPRVDLGAGASNIHTSVSLAPNRWVLATTGPKLGPAVLYWTELVVLILIALILGREKLTPLGTRQWLLLGLGFSTFSWYALALVAVWLLATGALRPWKSTLAVRQFNAVQVFFALLSVAALITIVVSLPVGLLGHPDMHVVGNESYGNYLKWFADRSDSLLPAGHVISVPLWIYKVFILVWALWLSFALLRWLPWVWEQFSADGLWKPRGSEAPAKQ